MHYQKTINFRTVVYRSLKKYKKYKKIQKYFKRDEIRCFYFYFASFSQYKYLATNLF